MEFYARTLFSLVFTCAMTGMCSGAEFHNEPGRPLIVLSAPSVNDAYYEEVFEQIIAYDIAFARSVMGKDNIVVLADAETMPFLQGALPADVLLSAQVFDIWIRDFSPMMFDAQVAFSYRPEYLPEKDARAVQQSLETFVQSLGVPFKKRSGLVMDGGNVVDNGKDLAVVTERIFADNPDMAEDHVVAALEKSLGARVAVIPEEAGDVTGHADGMVSFIGENTLLVNKYPEPFRSRVLSALQSDLPGVEIIETPWAPRDGMWKDFVSACGLNLNAIVTDNYIYVPVFGAPNDEAVLKIIKAHTHRKIVPVQASGVCFMGGSVRCLTWQLKGRRADALVAAARK